MGLKEKSNTSLKSKLSKFAAGIMLAVVFMSFIMPDKARADGNVFDFNNVKVTTTVEVSNSPQGPWTNTNFIRVGKDADFYVKVTIKLAGLQDNSGNAKSSLAVNSDKIAFSGWANSNKTITGIGPSFVAKLTQQQVDDITKRLLAGDDKSSLPGIPCYTEKVTSGGAAAANVVIIGGLVAAGVATGGAVAGGAAAAATALTSSGAAITGTGALAGALWGAGTSATAISAAAGVAGGIIGASWLPMPAGTYVKCDSPVRTLSDNTTANKPSSNTVFNVGDNLYQGIWHVPAVQYTNLGISQSAAATGDSSTQPVNEFYAIPDFYFSIWNGLRSDDFMSSISAGKSVYVQLFDTQAIANQHASDTVPSIVPNNGSNTGSGENAGATGSPLLGFLNTIIGAILGLIQEFIYAVFYWLIAPMIQAMLSIRTYTDTFVAVIYPAWLVVRNACNILFIVAVIAIAMGTMFRLESYQFKHLLVQLMIAALLVNFSLVIGQAILGFADTVQNQFLPNNAEVIRSLGKNMMVGYRDVVYNSDFAAKGYFSNTVKPLFFLSLSLGSFAVFLAIAAFLTVRIVALWILLMISPIAYVAGILPITSKYRTEWWQNFIKYAFFTPIMAFLLNIAALIANIQSSNPVFQQVNVNNIGGSGLAAFVFIVASNLILLVFLFAALNVASKLGVVGGDIASKVGKGFLGAPFKLAGLGIKTAAGYGAEKIHEKYHVQLNPYKWVEGFKKSRELNRAARERRGMLAGAGKSVLANPASFFQRYWDLENIGKALTGKNRQGRRKLALAEKLDKDAKVFEDKADELEKQTRMLDNEIDQLKLDAGELEKAGKVDEAKAKRDEAAKKTEEIKKKMAEEDALREKAEPLKRDSRRIDAEGRALVYADDYLTQEAARAGVHEEKGKIHAETWQELVSLGRGALAEKKADRFMAIYEKLAETYNENEITTHFQYPEDFDGADGVRHPKGSFFADSPEGMDDFNKLILQKELGMSEEAGSFFSADIADICEKMNHHNKMRAYDHAFGKVRLRPRKERIDEVTAEKGKMNMRVKYGQGNRLEGHEEIPSLHFDSDDIRVPITQEETINDIINSQETLRFMAQRGELVTSTAKALAFSGNTARLHLAALQKLDNTKPRIMKDYRSNPYVKVLRDANGKIRTDAQGKPVVQKTFTEREEFEYTLEALQDFGRNKWRRGEMEKYEKVLQEQLDKGVIPAWYVKDYQDAGYIDANKQITAKGREFMGSAERDHEYMLLGDFEREAREQGINIGPKTSEGGTPKATPEVED